MQFIIPKIVQPLALKDYAEEFGEARLYVWVNPPASLLNELNKSLMSIRDIRFPDKEFGPEKVEEFNQAIDHMLDDQLKCYSELLSQGESGTQMTVDDLKKIALETGETDPAFWMWVKQNVAELIRGHRAGSKKV